MAKRYYKSKKKSGMLSNANNDLANLPQESFIKVYPMAPSYLGESYRDDMYEMDRLMGKDRSKMTGKLQKDRF